MCRSRCFKCNYFKIIKKNNFALKDSIVKTIRCAQQEIHGENAVEICSKLNQLKKIFNSNKVTLIHSNILSRWDYQANKNYYILED